MPQNHSTRLIICLGGGIADDGGLREHVKLRVQCAVDLAREDDDAVIIFSSSFTLNKAPKLSESGYPISEASAMYASAKQLRYKGQAYCEQQSHDTIGSAYFTFSDFVSFLRPEKIQIVTSDFHIERAKFIYLHVSSLFNYNGIFEFIETSSNISNERISKELKSLQEYKNTWSKLSTICQFRKSLFTLHENYNEIFASSALNQNILDSY